MKWKKIISFLLWGVCVIWLFTWHTYGANWVFSNMSQVFSGISPVIVRFLSSFVQWGGYYLIYNFVMRTSDFSRTAKWWMLIISFAVGNFLLIYIIFP